MGMEIGNVRTADGTIGTQRAAAQQPADAVSKNIQSEISDVERQRKGLSSKGGMSAEEKVKKRQELQKELSSLNTKLRQRQAEIRKEQQREARMGELRAEAAGKEDAKKGVAAENGAVGAGKAGSRVQNAEDKAAGVRNGEKKTAGARGTEKSVSGAEKTKESRAGRSGQRKEQDASGVDETKKGATGVRGAEKKNAEVKSADKKEKETKLEDVAMPEAKVRKLMAADSAKERIKRQETVIARMENAIVILKGEIKQDEARGADTEQKKAQLKRKEEKVQQAVSAIPETDKSSGSIGERVQVRVDGGQEKNAQEDSGTGVSKDNGNGIVITAASLSKDMFQ